MTFYLESGGLPGIGNDKVIGRVETVRERRLVCVQRD